MTAPLFFADVEKLRAATIGAHVVLDGAEGRHAATVKRLTVGERVVLSDGAGLRCDAEITAVMANSIDARVLSTVTEPTPRPRLTVVQALAKGGGADRDERAVETMTEVGVDAIVPWQASRSIVRWDSARAAKGVERWRTTAREAAKQSRRSWIPQISDVAKTADVVRRLRASSGICVVLHEAATRPLSQLRTDVDEVVVIVGPEGGLSEDELAAFEDAGATACRLGPTVLRASTAGTVAAAVLLANSGRWAGATER
jgi:16S rRNA (uracil1498-N3)-methyltransferase